MVFELKGESSKMLSRVKFLQRKSENFILKFHLFSPIKIFPVEYFPQQSFTPKSSFLKYNFRWEMVCNKTNIKRNKITYCKSWHYHFNQIVLFLPVMRSYLWKTHHIYVVKPAMFTTTWQPVPCCAQCNQLN